ncbi:hypothetical protein [Yoonia sp. R2-816]|uniref:hypothetical protein n=1 Tax=Yoonia sp. R2-816 TaxID=3342638 RepID=UPI00372C288B
MKYYQPQLFQKAMMDDIAFDDVRDFFGLHVNIDNYAKAERHLLWMHEWWATFLNGTIDEERRDSILSSIFKYHMDKNSVIQICARSVVDRFWQGSVS